ncbi:hypothetical protein PV08_10906 [Exophiala spinifera]|uniref:Uncharacterized protein n=1 Tax=Exophiala spinifera TaxID=91928 RepID=A0A0D2AYU8_9EURO|nr:uncharacterized protein PV08_10906 [Exophiala spinifera]KIW11605.1 hypothetical protein PV08_10906 [Exophiala spinifera]
MGSYRKRRQSPESDEEFRESTPTPSDTDESVVSVPKLKKHSSKRRKQEERDDPRDRPSTILLHQGMASEYSSDNLKLRRLLCSVFSDHLNSCVEEKSPRTGEDDEDEGDDGGDGDCEGDSDGEHATDEEEMSEDGKES